MNSSKQKPEKAASKNDKGRERMDRFFFYWRKFRFYRSLCTALLAFIVYLGAKAYSSHQEPTQLRFVEDPNASVSDSATSGDRPQKPIFSGEAYLTAQRLRECGALVMAVSLSAFERVRMNGTFPGDGHEILIDLQKRSLLPPGIKINDSSLRSSLSEIAFRYRSDPFSFEIVSLPGAGVEGPALLFRFPIPSGDANSIVYFQSRAKTTAVIPGSFSSIEQLAASGWSIARWRGEVLPLDQAALRELHEQDEWLKSQNQGR